MIQTALLQNAHEDLITDARYDAYGLRLATCALDQRIKVWALDETSGTWSVEEEWKAHDAAPTSLAWAHPQYGSVLASASFDRTVKIWEYVPGASFSASLSAHAPALNGANSGSGAGPSGGSKWVERTTLTEAKGSVRAVEFAPHHFGLKLAAISSDNTLRIYECLEQPNLTTWTAEEIDVPTLLPPRGSAPSSSGNNTAATGPAASVTARAAALASALATPTPAHSGAAGAGDTASLAAGVLAAQQAQAQAGAGAGIRPGVGAREADGGWCLSWCKDRYWGEVIAVGYGVTGVVKIIKLSVSRRPHTLLLLEPPPVHPPSTSGGAAAPPRPGSRHGSNANASSTNANAAGDTETPYAVTSVAWAPSCGRSFHLVATGSRDGRVRIWKVRPPPIVSVPGGLGLGGVGGVSSGIASGLGVGSDVEEAALEAAAEERWSASLVAEFDDHGSSVGRVEWNITGTVLSSAGNDGKVRLWKQTVGGVWRPAGHISVEQAEERAKDVDMDENSS